MSEVEVVLVVLVVLLVVVVFPQVGGVGLMAALQVALSARRESAQMKRHVLPVLCSGHAALHIFNSMARKRLQSLGQRAAEAVALHSKNIVRSRRTSVTFV
jgi:hypothetical protein